MKKEIYQIFRDPSSILIAFILPLLLLFLFAFGISLDLKNINIGIVLESQSPASIRLVDSFQKSKYFNIKIAKSRNKLEPLLIGGRLNALIVIPYDFEKRLLTNGKHALQIIVSGTDANSGALLLNYIESTFVKWEKMEGINRGIKQTNLINIEPRVWFNEEIESRATLLPGSIAIIIILIGTMLTSLIIAREWERGTMEALLATSLTKTDLLLGKFIPYFILGMIATIMISAISIIGFGVPFKGSLWVLLILSSAYLSFALGLGLFISTISRNQFISSLVALTLLYYLGSSK